MDDFLFEDKAEAFDEDRFYKVADLIHDLFSKGGRQDECVKQLACIDWQTYGAERKERYLAKIEREYRREQEWIADCIQKGGGYCGMCKEVFAFEGALYPSPPGYTGKYCRTCRNKILEEINADRPIGQHLDMCQRCKVYSTDVHSPPWSIRLPPDVENTFCCPECLAQVIKKNTLQCILCEKDFIRVKSGDYKSLCGTCRNKQTLYEYGRVESHNERARVFNLAATLTLKQWVATLEHFNWQCAYCAGEFRVMEHYLPLDLGGGTIAENCLPACKTCNSRKSNRHPSKLGHLFPTENLARIREWLAAQVAV